MGDVRWYKRDPNAALSGFAVLTLEERGAYDTVLDLIYAHAGDLNDDDHYLAGWMRCDVRVWRRLKKRLLELGKIYLASGKIRNKRADRELDAAQHRIASAARAGLQSAANRRAARNIINGLSSTDVERPFQLPTPTKNITSSEYVAAREDDSPSVIAMRERLARGRAGRR